MGVSDGQCEHQGLGEQIAGAELGFVGYIRYSRGERGRQAKRRHSSEAWWDYTLLLLLLVWEATPHHLKEANSV